VPHLPWEEAEEQEHGDSQQETPSDEDDLEDDPNTNVEAVNGRDAKAPGDEEEDEAEGAIMYTKWIRSAVYKSG